MIVYNDNRGWFCINANMVPVVEDQRLAFVNGYGFSKIMWLIDFVMRKYFGVFSVIYSCKVPFLSIPYVTQGERCKGRQ